MLVAVAVSAAHDGLPGTAAIIGLCGASLLGVVGWVQLNRYRIARVGSQDPESSI